MPEILNEANGTNKLQSGCYWTLCRVSPTVIRLTVDKPQFGNHLRHASEYFECSDGTKCQ